MKYINREHPEYVARAAMWKKYRDLYAGGEEFRQNASDYLVRRSREPGEVYGERLNRVFYENYVGSIVDWYGATLMRREPVIIAEGQNEPGKSFFREFTENCDRKGTDLTEFFRQRLIEAMVYGSSWITVDFPRFRRKVATRAEEDALGRSRAFLASYTPEEVINWSYDDQGQLEWAVLRTSHLRQGKVTDETWRNETRWLYYDRQNFRLYGRSGEEGSEIELLDEGRHGLANLGRIPLFQLKVSGGLWLLNKAAALQLEHFNKSNALAWALTMGLFAMPVVYSEREWNQMVGESYFIQLGPSDRFGWTEPEGHVFQIASDNLVRLKDEIYRVCYLMIQAWGSNSPQAQQSGWSKAQDLSVTHEVLRAYGDAVKETMRQVLHAIEEARRDGLLIDVSGFDEFDIGDFGAELANAKALLEMGIESETLRRQVHKKVALKYLSDTRQALKSQIADEIDAACENRSNAAVEPEVS